MSREELEASSSVQWNGLSLEKLASAFQRYSRLLRPVFKQETQRVERGTGTVLNAERTAGRLKIPANSDVHHLLLRSTSEPALDWVANAGPGEGL